LCNVIIQIGELKGFSKSMFKSYQRTPVAYLLASHHGGVVVGTGNLDEDGYLYYYCKFGDGAVDVGLIWDIHKSEVFQLAAYLGVPESILVAPPSADLAPGQTDEAEIGATYNMVELVYIFVFHYDEKRKALFLSCLSAGARTQFDAEFKNIQVIHERGQHKADLNPKNMGSPWFFEQFPELEEKA
jgi:NAD+ synthase (glutamine-hydrolysing)